MMSLLKGLLISALEMLSSDMLRAVTECFRFKTIGISILRDFWRLAEMAKLIISTLQFSINFASFEQVNPIHLKKINTVQLII
jgi:hypothetical protein